MNSPASARAHWSPLANTFLSAIGEFVIQVELGGLKNEDLELEAAADHICIHGQRHLPGVDVANQVLNRGIPDGGFKSVFDIPAGFDPLKATAQYRNGILCITVPKGPAWPTRQQTCFCWR